MNREWRILVALEETAVPHPAPLLLGGPDGPLGSPLLIMARVDGFTPVGVLPAPYDHPRGRRDLAFALVDALADLAAVPWRERRLDGLVYACAKAGLNALTVGLADAFGPRVRVNAILPGAVLTDIAKAWPADRLRRASEDVPLGRAGQPADLVGTALWLASRASEWVTGVMVRVDGGLYRQTS
jgi:NAD(P)-dependent dehydrogenase (short-subunit alcohol dehydrogenase family)